MNEVNEILKISTNPDQSIISHLGSSETILKKFADNFFAKPLEIGEEQQRFFAALFASCKTEINKR